MRTAKLLTTAAATAVVAMFSGGVAALIGACSDPFNTDGYVQDGGGARDATTGPGVDGGAPDGSPPMVDGGVGVVSSDGITDSTCIPRSCSTQGVECGDASDLCGRQLDCGVCHMYGDVCTNGKCGCVPKTPANDCTGLCGSVPDGCGGFYDCSPCGMNSFCGPYNTCSTATCTPVTDPQNACGTISDGCGATRTAANGTSCPTTNVNNGCNQGDEANRCDCFPSSCAQQGYTCSIPGSKAVGDLCQDPNATCSACTYPPGQCNAEHGCNTCTRVAAPAFPYDSHCQGTALTEAWACDCVDGGTCVVPDGYTAQPVTCQFYESTSAHAIYCCKANN